MRRPARCCGCATGVLVAQRFDPTREVISDQPIPVAQTVGLDGGVLRGAFAVSATGVLAHRAGRGERRQLTWVDRAGIARGTVGPPDEDALGSPELAPDGRRVAVHRAMQGNTDVWLIDTGRDLQSRFTFDASSEGHPLWSPDGSRVVFRSLRNGHWDLFEKAASGAGDEQPLLVTEGTQVAVGLVARWAGPALRSPASEDRNGPLGPAAGRRPQAVPRRADALRRVSGPILARRAVGVVSVERIRASGDLRPTVSRGPAARGRCRRKAGASRGGGPTGRNCSISRLTPA